MFLLQTILKLALTLCGVVGIAFMIASTVLVICAIIRGGISIQVFKDEAKKEKLNK